MFRQLGIFSQVGQLYQPQDRDQLMYYREDKSGQILQEGINEPGAFSSLDRRRRPPTPTTASRWCRSTSTTRCSASSGSATSPGRRATAGRAGSCSAAPPGRTTLNGEGLQHEDGHSHIQASLIPNCVSYDPTYNYELAVIIQDGLRRMYAEQEDVFFYITLMNENYAHPAMPEGVGGGHPARPVPAARAADGAQVQLMGSGTILREVMAGAELLRDDFGVEADVWSATSLHRAAPRRHGRRARGPPGRGETPARRTSRSCLEGREGPIVAATDYIRAFRGPDPPLRRDRADGRSLGTDGFGRSDYRGALRSLLRGRPPPRRPRRAARARRGRRGREGDRASTTIDAEVEAPWRR